MSAIRRMMMANKGGEQDPFKDWITCYVYVATANSSRTLNANGYGSSVIDRMIVDGEEITPVTSMTFATTGNHPVKILLKDKTAIPAKYFNAGHFRNMVAPACVTSIGTDCFRNYGTNNSSTMTFLATTPPTLSSDPFYNRHGNPVYVPSASLSAYQTAWSMMTNIRTITT